MEGRFFDYHLNTVRLFSLTAGSCVQTRGDGGLKGICFSISSISELLAEQGTFNHE